MALVQIPYCLAVPPLGPLVIPGGFVWAVSFALPKPAEKHGWILQEVDTFDELQPRGGEPFVQSRHHWAAWPIAAGQRMVTEAAGKQDVAAFFEMQNANPPDVDLKQSFNHYLYTSFAKGMRGRRRVRAVAGFYDEPLPPFFGWKKLDVDAGRLMASRRPPPFWRPLGCNRTLDFAFDYRRARTPRHATLTAG